MLYLIEPQILDKPFKLGIVVSRFNSFITERLLQGALERLQELSFPHEYVTVVWVPGAVEISLITQQLAQTKNYEAIICLGAIIQGETDHYHYVCQQVSDGCQKVALDNNIPVIFGVLTTTNVKQAKERSSQIKNHKGREAVEAAIHTVSVIREIHLNHPITS